MKNLTRGHTMSDSRKPVTTRRDAVKLGLFSGLTALTAGGLRNAFAADTASPLLTRVIPSTGEKLPCVGIGTNSFALADVPNLQVVLKRMYELGGTFIDSAASYKESEAATGAALEAMKMRDKFFISTKISSGAKIMGDLGGEKSFERSLERLKTNRLDLLLVHNMLGTDELMPRLLDWKKAGKIRYLGVCTSQDSDHPQMVECMKKYPLDFVEVNYSIAKRDSELNVLPLALERKIAVVVNQPFGGKHEENLFLNNTRVLPTWAADIGCTSWSEFLLKFVLGHPAVTTVVPGTTKTEHMESNLHAGRGVMPDAAMRKRMADVWNV
jgi:aryl-alcohol dehydrogenase-like predicted oxidoreductase